MFTIPVYVAATNCGTTLVLIFQVSVVVVLPTKLKNKKINARPICTPVAEAGVMNAGTPAPPLVTVFNAPPALPEPAAAAVTALAGILSPAPSVKAAVPLGTQAHTVTWVRPNLRAQDVWTVVVVLPALAAVLGASVKFTFAPPVTFTIRDSGAVAFRVTVPTFEFRCAFAAGGMAATSNHPTAITSILCKFKLLTKPLFSNQERQSSIGVAPFAFAAARPRAKDIWPGERISRPDVP
jgi:hypothetical protein